MMKAAARKDANWTARNERVNARVSRGDVDLIFIGDSVVQGWEEKGKKAWEKYYGKRKAVNAGIGGDRAENVLWRLEHGNVEGIRPRLAVVMMGGDYGSGSTGEEIAAGTSAVVERLRVKLPKTKILLVGILPCEANEEDGRRQVIRKANERIAKLADGDWVHYLDVGYVFVGEEEKPREELMPDEFHLSAKGYMVLGEWLEAEVQILMDEMEDAVLPVPLSIHDWWHNRHQELNARAREGGVELIFIGDSLTNGWSGAGKEVWERFYGKRKAVNLGISCERTQNVLWRLEHGNIDGISPKLAVVLIGANNAAGRSTLEDTAAGIKAIVKRLRKKLPRTKILLLGLMPRGANEEYRWWQANMRVNRELPALADGKSVFYFEMGSRFALADGTINRELYEPDLSHFTARGYQAWAEAIEGMVAKLMN